jgi:outer membrane scaffolding protein for murein synthesis (MipA/OmpV family)
MTSVRTTVLATLATLLITTAPPLQATPLWELGLGAATLHLPDYRGADVSHGYLLPLPYVVYRGQWLRADREGARAVLIDTPGWELNLSAHASAPVRSRDNPARAGMANLPATIELGPKLTAHLWEAEDKSAQLDLLLPVRAVMAVSRSPGVVGAVAVPALNLDLPRRAGWNVSLVTGIDIGSRRLHDHYYGVSAQDATADRPAWQARGGFGGWHLLAAASRRFERTWVGVYLRHDRLGGAVFADSPLVRRRSALSAGIGVSWVLAQSSEEARSDD